MIYYSTVSLTWTKQGLTCFLYVSSQEFQYKHTKSMMIFDKPKICQVANI